jgi:hypothetical protein
MTKEEFKAISIVDYLRSLNYTPCRYIDSRDRYWYFSPLHTEKTPSFKVDMKLNLWYDFGLNIGGDIIYLVQQLNPGMCYADVFRLLERFATGHAVKSAPAPSIQKELADKEQLVSDNTLIQRIGELSHRNLLAYLASRRISLAVARKYCKEIHYSTGQGKNYYGIGFPNVTEGWEFRNPFFKRSIGNKQISWIHDSPDRQSGCCCLFEGFFDFLSYMTLKEWPDIGLCLSAPSDYIVLNSVTMLPKALPLLESYADIHCFLDNDDAGRSATAFVMKQFADKATDESTRYVAFKDVNDVLTGIRLS